MEKYSNHQSPLSNGRTAWWVLEFRIFFSADNFGCKSMHRGGGRGYQEGERTVLEGFGQNLGLV
jgi:hypothetical protein